MATPFDGKTWRLRYDSNLTTGPGHQIEAPQNGPVAPTFSSNAFLPLKQRTTFSIDVAAEGSAIVYFDDNTPENIRTIWAQAQDVYYDEAFHTIRGDVFFDSHTGSPESAHSHHFVITYRGRYGQGGTKRQLYVRLFEENATFEPTADLVRLRLGPPGFFWSHKGSWKADD